MGQVNSISVPAAQLHTLAAVANGNLTSPDDQGDITLVTYSTLPGGSSPTVCIAGRKLLDSLATEPKDAHFFEEAAANPTYSTLTHYISHNQRDINTFATALWFCLGIVIAVGTALVVLRLIRGDRSRKPRKTYMPGYILCMTSLAMLVVLLIYLLICAISTRDALVLSLVEKAPDMKRAVFTNLRAYVKDIVEQMAEMGHGNLTRHTVVQAVSLLTSGFRKGFQKFLEDKFGGNWNVPFYGVAPDCVKDVGHSERLDKDEGLVTLSGSVEAIRVKSEVTYRRLQGILERIAERVADTTSVDRLRVVEGLRDSAMQTATPNETDDIGKVALDSVDALEAKLTEFENRHGVYRFISGTLMLLLLVLLLLLLNSTGALFASVAVGLYAQHSRVESHKRSNISHFVGYMFASTAFLFTLYVLLAIPMTAVLTVYITLPECYMCSPYRRGHYDVLDDALSRFWPPERRLEILRRLVPSEIFTKCKNESVSIFDLAVPSPKREARNSYNARLDQPKQVVLVSSLGGGDQDDFQDNTDIVHTLPEAMINASYCDPLNQQGNVTRNVHNNRWIRFKDVGLERQNEDSIVKALIPAVSSCYAQFMTLAVADAERLLMDTPQVIGPCYIADSVLSAVLDVTCGLFTTELVGHWCALLLAVVLSVLVIPLAFSTSRYYIRTRRFRRKKARGTKEKPRKQQRANRRKKRDSLVQKEQSTQTSSESRSSSRGDIPSSTVIRRWYSVRTSRRCIAQTTPEQPRPHVRSPLQKMTSWPMIRSVEPTCSYPVDASWSHTYSQTALTPSPTAQHMPFVHSHTTIFMSPCNHLPPPSEQYSDTIVVMSSPCHHSPQSPQQRIIEAAPPHPQQYIRQPTSPAPPQQMIVPLVMLPPMPPVFYPPFPPQQIQPPPQPTTLGDGSAENQQAATAHTTINFFGAPGPEGYMMGSLPPPLQGYTVGTPVSYAMPVPATTAQPYYVSGYPYQFEKQQQFQNVRRVTSHVQQLARSPKKQ